MMNIILKKNVLLKHCRIEDNDYLNLIDLEKIRRQENSFEDLYREGNNKIYHRNNRFLSTHTYGASTNEKDPNIDPYYTILLQKLFKTDPEKDLIIYDILNIDNATLPGFSDNHLNHILWIYNDNGYANFLPIGFSNFDIEYEKNRKIIDQIFNIKN